MHYQNLRTEVTAGKSPLINDEVIRDVLKEMKELWPFARSVSSDTFSKEVYSRQRIKDLSKKGADYLKRIYGTRIARERSDLVLRRGLRVDDNVSSEYQRNIPSQVYRQLCEHVYQSHLKRTADNTVFFVNSMHAVNQLQALRIPDLQVRSSNKLAHGLFAMEVEKLSDPKNYETLMWKVRDRLHMFGFMPSIYQVIKLAARGKVDVRKKSNTPIDSSVVLNDLCNGELSPVHLLRKTPESHHTRPAALTVASLLDGLKEIQPSLNDNMIIADCLRAAEKIVQALPALRRDSERFRSGYSALMDELHIILAVAKPYTQADFKSAAKAMLTDRVGKALQDVHIEEPETFLFSSGMNAIVSAIEVARKLAGDQDSVIELVAGDYHLEYFEVIDLRKVINESLDSSSENGLDKANILLGILNPSTPAWSPGTNDYQWNVESLVHKVSSVLSTKERAPKASSTILVLDTTIEKEGDLQRVMHAFKDPIEQGSLKILLCKSYQKYINLLSAKIMAGGVTVIGSRDEETNTMLSQLRDLENDLGWMKNEESQLLVHFMKCCHPMELSLLKQAAKNADFVRRICIPAESAEAGLLRWEEGNPLLVFADNNIFLSDFTFAKGAKKIERADLANIIGPLVPYRDSFAFSESVQIGVAGVLGGPLERTRISMGQEGFHELIEKFYAFGRLYRRNAQFSLELALHHSTRAIDSACHKLIREDNATLWGDTALRNLRRRAAESGIGVTADSTIDEGERLLELLRAPSSQPEARVEAEKRLAELLIPIVSSGFGEKSDILADKIALLGAVNQDEAGMGPHLGGSLPPLLTGLGKDVEHVSELSLVEAKFAINIVASYMNLAIGIVKSSSFDLKDVMETDGPHQGLRDILRALAKSRMPGVSQGVRAGLLFSYITIIANELEKDPGNKLLITDLNTAVSALRYPEDKAKALFLIKDPVYKNLPVKTQEDIVRETFGPLDHASRLKVIEKLVSERAYAQVSSCFQFYASEFDRVKSGTQEFFRPKDLLNFVDDGMESMPAWEKSILKWELLRHEMDVAILKAAPDNNG
jgi:hypothetical protein